MGADNLEEAVSQSDIIIAGLPASVGGEKFNTPLYSEDIYIDDYDDFGTISFAVPCKFDVESFAMDFIGDDDEG